MAPRKTKSTHKQGASLMIAIEGVTPRTVAVRDLVEVLEATAKTFEALAKEKHLPPPQLSLTRVTNGSAAYQLASEDPQARRAISAFEKTVRTRGEDASPQTRLALHRLHRAGANVGAGLYVVPGAGGPASKRIPVVAPLADDAVRIEEATVVFARVVGVHINAHDRVTVTIRYDDGGSGEFRAEADVIERATRLFGKHVEARVTFVRGEDRDADGEIEELYERGGSEDLLTAMSNMRKDLEDEGLEFDAAAWLREERGDE